MKAHKFINLKHESMSMKKLSTKLNALAKYVSRVANTNKGKMEIFINRLLSDIAKDVMIEKYAISSYSKALSKADRLEAIRLWKAWDWGILNQSNLVALTQRSDYVVLGANQ